MMTTLKSYAAAAALLTATAPSVWALEVYRQQDNPNFSSHQEYALSEAWHLKCESKLDAYQQSAKLCELEATTGRKQDRANTYQLLNGLTVKIWNAYDPYKGIEPSTSVQIDGVMANRRMAIRVGGQEFVKMARNQAHGFEWYAQEANKIILQLLNAPDLRYEYDLFARHVNRNTQSLSGFKDAWDYAVEFTQYNPFRGIGL